jgi:homoisocitrate dehydrogenase
MIRICSIYGDGIGQEVIPVAERLLAQLVPDVEFVQAQAGFGTFQECGSALPAATLEVAKSADAVLFGAVGSPSHPVEGYRSPIVQLRRELDLYANLRPTEGPRARLLIVRENTEGLYAGRERLEGETAIAERVVTVKATRRIVQKAFDEARAGGFSKVTLVHKANVLRVTDGLFRTTALEVAAQNSDIPMDEMLVDTAAMKLAESPEMFEVVVTTNLFGDILSDVAAIHGGGIGLASSANVGESHGLFEPVHGSAPDIAGKGIANPSAACLSAAMMLEWLGSRRSDASLSEAGSRLNSAVRRAVPCQTTEDWERQIKENLGLN